MTCLIRFFSDILLFCLLGSIALVLVFKFVPIPFTPLMLKRHIEAHKEGYHLELQHQWTPLEDISPGLIAAVIDYEDAKFYEHKGFDWDAISYAYQQNQRYGCITGGGSTISQQTAKNVFLWPSRSWVRKGLEVYFTFLIELVWGKERIMEVYLNVAETGHGIYGVEMASQIYFKKPAKKMSKWEAARLISIFPNPLKFSVVNPSKRTLRKQEIVMKRMNSVGQIPFLK